MVRRHLEGVTFRQQKAADWEGGQGRTSEGQGDSRIASSIRYGCQQVVRKNDPDESHQSDRE